MKKAMTGNAADPGQVKEAGRKERKKRRDELKDLNELLQIPGFRRFAWRLLGFAGLNQTVMTAADPVIISYNAGRQDIAHFLLSEILSARPEAFLEMQQEHHKGEENEGD